MRLRKNDLPQRPSAMRSQQPLRAFGVVHEAGVDLQEVGTGQHSHPPVVCEKRGLIGEALLKPISHGGKGDILQAAAPDHLVEHVECRKGAIFAHHQAPLQDDHAQVELEERPRVVIGVREGFPANVPLERIPVGGNPGFDVRIKPDLHVACGSFGAVTCGQEDRW